MTAASRPSSHWLAWLLWWLTCAFTLLGLFFLGLSWSAPVPDAFAFRGHPAPLALVIGFVGQFLARRLSSTRSSHSCTKASNRCACSAIKP